MYYSFGYLIGVIIVAVVFGLITKHINESKGYQGGFAWGFWLGFIGIIVVACRSDTRVYTQTQNRNTADSSYSVHHDESVVDELKKYKDVRYLFLIGLILLIMQFLINILQNLI